MIAQIFIGLATEGPTDIRFLRVLYVVRFKILH